MWDKTVKTRLTWAGQGVVWCQPSPAILTRSQRLSKEYSEAVGRRDLAEMRTVSAKLYTIRHCFHNRMERFRRAGVDEELIEFWQDQEQQRLRELIANDQRDARDVHSRPDLADEEHPGPGEPD